MSYYFVGADFECPGGCEIGTSLYNKRALLFELNYKFF